MAKAKEDGRFQQRSFEEYGISSSSSANTRPQHALGNQTQAELAIGALGHHQTLLLELRQGQSKRIINLRSPPPYQHMI
jgi:hypothetical protein